jgi:hypothetical protein
MGRKFTDDEWRVHELAVESRRLMAKVARKPKRSTALSAMTIENARLKMEEMRRADDWSHASALHLVVLWEWLHEQVYGVRPSMRAAEWRGACFAAGKLLKERFDGKPERMFEFLRWTWAEERRTLAWRRENHRTVTPLGWRLQFSERHCVKWTANGGGA